MCEAGWNVGLVALVVTQDYGLKLAPGNVLKMYAELINPIKRGENVKFFTKLLAMH